MKSTFINVASFTRTCTLIIKDHLLTNVLKFIYESSTVGTFNKIDKSTSNLKTLKF